MSEEEQEQQIIGRLVLAHVEAKKQWASWYRRMIRVGHGYSRLAAELMMPQSSAVRLPKPKSSSVVLDPDDPRRLKINQTTNTATILLLSEVELAELLRGYSEAENTLLQLDQELMGHGINLPIETPSVYDKEGT